jgi:adenosylcobinamide-GDP ribazoletransferase
VRRGLRLAVSLFTVWRVDVPEPERADARWAMTFLPLVGLLVGGAAAGATWAMRLLVESHETAMLAAAAGVATLAFLTRGLHLDGLADTVDGLGSLRPADEAVAIMRRGDVGPLGVVAVVLTLLLQAAALAACVTSGRATEGLVGAVVAGRVAAVLSCTPPTKAFDTSGLGALVAGSVSRAVAFGWAGLLAVAAFGYAFVDDRGGWRGGVRAVAGVVAALAAAHWLRSRAVRRLGGITGDVLGAQVEVATTVALVVAAFDVLR